MKIHKRITSGIHLLMASSALFFTGCGDSLLDSLNENIEIIEGGGSVAQTVDQASGMFLEAQALVHDTREHKYQYQFNLHIDNYAGYLCAPNDFSGKLTSTYFFNKDFASGPRANFFWVAEQTLPVMKGAKDLDLEEIGAMSSILYCYSAQELVDIHGPFPWWDYKCQKQNPPLTYYKVEDIYDSIFTDLKKAADILKNYTATPAEHQILIEDILSSKDRLCGGKVDLWRKFANSLRLRLAMHISTANPEKAKAEAMAALNDGVLEEGDPNVAYNVSLYGGYNPLEFISRSWQDTRLNASFENLLKRLQSPLLETWFSKNSGEICDMNGKLVLAKDEKIVGMRAGTLTLPRDNTSNFYKNFSPINTKYSFAPVYLMKVSEVLFLQAEAALRWEITSADPFYWYDGGIYRSFKDENLTDEAYEQYSLVEIPENIDYVDYHDNYNNAKGLVTIGVAWSDDDSKEVKLEKIITQKYIANFPMSLEAWTDLRRTGFPKIFPVVWDDGDGTIPEGDIIRRMPYLINDDSDKEDVLNSAIPALGGGDYQGTRLWWDTGILFN
ncbi:SusD/RagB family nutrient-binding outer membrane lipoprotein [Bacteroides salyersiae]|uniref:SusD/RagB family nutrient-binding outer membrane lipoprotein n=1 Tax=Bacteroides salyersiae TaxID=291644 RepID=UPI00189A9481|nr:SusD/RagB family nutrient-binding outer membrane lipoprotein [Bacteroides salyersiae]